MRTIYQSDRLLIHNCFVEEWKRIRPMIIATLRFQEERTLEFVRELGCLDFTSGFELVPHCYSTEDFEKEFGEWFNG